MRTLQFFDHPSLEFRSEYKSINFNLPDGMAKQQLYNKPIHYASQILDTKRLFFKHSACLRIADTLSCNLFNYFCDSRNYLLGISIRKPR